MPDAASPSTAPAEVLADIPKNRRETLRITRETYRGHEFVQIRVWFAAEDGELRPGKSGVSLQPDKLDVVIATLQKARLKMTSRGAL